MTRSVPGPPLSAPIKVIDLFAGCGGLTEGFLRIGVDGKALPEGSQEPSAFQPVAAVELDPAAALTYAENFGSRAGGTDHVYVGDITQWADTDIQSADVILGGPPCQGFSGLNKTRSGDARNELWRQYFKVVEKAKPQIFIIENVDRFRTSDEFEALRLAFKEEGYTIKPAILNAADYGVPQARKRTIVIGTREGCKPVEHPDPGHEAKNPAAMRASMRDGTLCDALAEGEAKTKKTKLPWRTLRECLVDVPHEVNGTELPDLDADGNPATVRISRRTDESGFLTSQRIDFLRTRIPGPFTTEQLHIGRTPTALSLARYAAIKEGQNRHALAHSIGVDGKSLSTPNWISHRSGSGDVMGRLYWDRPSVTIRTEFFKPEKGRYLHPVANRPITHLEAALIQGFPRDFRWCGSKTQIARQIGNAVPVGLSMALAEVVYRALRGSEDSA
ncbi:DNA cytosine methyltransferase [Streptomyces meridianus]|uniref:Cytosine-specific methyltransferase n=1 Tax=Streptomyces meridianus TaxID=2938945 RepID=A0ABT0WZX3_9ACTN|nr:DNA cytosine methyltransferase [Streptomyces meridianus]MCM2575859.1 DNA cytosine methyltransferase [Streptomyces meridianus]